MLWVNKHDGVPFGVQISSSWMMETEEASCQQNRDLGRNKGRGTGRRLRAGSGWAPKGFVQMGSITRGSSGTCWKQRFPGLTLPHWSRIYSAGFWKWLTSPSRDSFSRHVWKHLSGTQLCRNASQVILEWWRNMHRGWAARFSKYK